ncbi:hypothetical protein [Thiomicrorhabdus heinhorstiae]|uniref:Uncharacterized protein n=1 Tax=Thiomicrorhabdus heinhorstiae TaxID=2748010 RepID=A0ABS0C191_9GAMM|nr:hypothetical protein [Thiomicrorhabdus heinhorstiae]MBF6057991.1 hypothetical protein [Thiomicrorhabdus heinhorstiae]
MSLQISQKNVPGLLHLRGKKLNEILASFDAADLQVFQYKSLAENQFVAKLGEEELYVCADGSVSVSTEHNQYAFRRGDAIFEVAGNWKNLMAEVCIYDFRQSCPGDFLMVAMAGISAWLLIPEEGKPLILGCDPTFGHYLLETLTKQIETSPFLKTERENDD